MDDEENVSSLLRKYLTPELLEEYMLVTTPAPVDAYLYDCAVSGFEHHDAPVGIFAADADSYDVFNKLFDPIIKDYHGQMDNENDVLQKDPDFGNVDEIENLIRAQVHSVRTNQIGSQYRRSALLPQTDREAVHRGGGEGAFGHGDNGWRADWLLSDNGGHRC